MRKTKLVELPRTEDKGEQSTFERPLVTGGAGFIGSHLTEHLATWGNVTVIDNFSSGRKENLTEVPEGRLQVLYADLRKDDLKAFVVDTDIIFHFAANPEVRISTTSPRIHFEDNLVATFNLLEAWRRHGDGEILVFASSSSVYGEPDVLPVTEGSQLRPVSVYGATKVACEALLRSYSNLYGLQSVVLRYANVIGSRLTHGVVYDFVKKLKRNPHRLEILGDGTQRRNFLYVEDAVVASLKAVQNASRNFDCYNIGGEDYLRVDEVAALVTRSLGLKDVKFVHCATEKGLGWPGDVRDILLDCRKIRGLGFEPSMDSREAVRQTVLGLIKNRR